MQPTKEIALNPKLTLILRELQKGLNETREKNELLNMRLNDILTGICLNEDLNFDEVTINFNDTTTKIIVSPKTEEAADSETPPAKTAVKKALK